jgi:hypothetical protein
LINWGRDFKEEIDNLREMELEGMYDKYNLSTSTDDGFVILDNSDRFFKTARFLGDQNLKQVDFSGLKH